MKRILILGAGTAGTMMANKLAGVLPAREWTVTVVDRDDAHIYQPGLLFLPFGETRAERLVRPRSRTTHAGVDLRLCGVEALDMDRKRARLGDGSDLAFDLLIVATGTRLVPEATEGLTSAGWYDTAFDFYTLGGAAALQRKLAAFDKGRLVVNFVDMPIKCPVAPLEFAFLADAYFTKRGVRDAVEIVYATPLDGAFTKPVASRVLGELLSSRNIQVQADFALASVDGEGRQLKTWDDSTLDYDLLVSVPLHQGAEVIERAGIGDAAGFVPTDKHTLQSKAFDFMFALGDATDLPTSKAGSVAHFQAEVLVGNVLRHIRGEGLAAEFDGHANCFIETGHDKALLIDFNYDTEPLPGRFPLAGLGPFTLLGESAVNHWGKLGFEWAYWNLLLEGLELPIGHAMTMTGKWRDAA